MEELKENNAPRDRAILVGLSSPRLDKKENADEESLEELGALVETAGGISVGVVLQTLPSPNPHTFIGEGKVDEIRELVKSQEAASRRALNCAARSTAASPAADTSAKMPWVFRGSGPTSPRCCKRKFYHNIICEGEEEQH